MNQNERIWKEHKAALFGEGLAMLSRLLQGVFGVKLCFNPSRARQNGQRSLSQDLLGPMADSGRVLWATVKRMRKHVANAGSQKFVDLLFVTRIDAYDSSNVLAVQTTVEKRLYRLVVWFVLSDPCPRANFPILSFEVSDLVDSLLSCRFLSPWH